MRVAALGLTIVLVSLIVTSALATPILPVGQAAGVPDVVADKLLELGVWDRAKLLRQVEGWSIQGDWVFHDPVANHYYVFTQRWVELLQLLKTGLTEQELAATGAFGHHESHATHHRVHGPPGSPTAELYLSPYQALLRAIDWLSRGITVWHICKELLEVVNQYMVKDGNDTEPPDVFCNATIINGVVHWC